MTLRSISSPAFLLAIFTLLATAGCGDDAPADPGQTTGASGGAGGDPGAGGIGATGGGSTGGEGGAGEYVPTPADIEFAVLGDVPAGERIAFNDWNTQPNVLSTMAPDGTDVQPLFAAYRVWSLGVAHAGDRVAFASGDPLQAEHYGVTIGDGIQHTFLYDVASRTASVLSYGNLNDECHRFSADDAMLYVCRRYDFMPDNTNKTYRIGVIEVASAAFTWLTPESTALALHPEPQPGGVFWFTDITIEGGSQHRRIVAQPITGGRPTLVRDDASTAVPSPDGTRYLYADSAAGSVLMSSMVGGGGEILVADAAVTNARYSPDGTRVVYLVYDDALACSHVEIVAADGSEATTPTRIRDCGTTDEFITDLDWFTAP